jgi:ABC-2 type transport system ATP-binding protein
MINAERLTKWFGNFLAVDSVDFQIPRGQVVGFLGPNGAGKTTTIRMITGFLPPTDGTVTVDGVDVTKDVLGVRRRIGYLPESAPLYVEMRVEELLRFRARLFGIAKANRKAAIDRVIERCTLGEVRRRPIQQLSRGFRQRVGLASVLLHEPPVLILDEPTVGLDPQQIRDVRQLIRDLAGEHTVLLSTHILPEAEASCDRLLVIARGRVRAEGTIDELRALAAKRQRYVVETAMSGAADTVKKIRGVIEGEAGERASSWQRLTVTAGGGGDLREAIADKLSAMGSSVRELRREAPSLEQMFVRINAEAEADFAARGTATDDDDEPSHPPTRPGKKKKVTA